MAEDSFTEVTNTSWFSRLGGAVKGILFGLFLFLIAFPILFWNEGRAVKTYKSLKEGGGAVVSVMADRVELANAGKLVHLTGRAVTEITLTDSAFGVSVNALKLRRNVQMYQWQESSESKTEKKLGGGTETVTEYSYSRTWSDTVIRSAGFKESSGHENPGSMPYASSEQTAGKVTVGAFTLSSSLVSGINRFERLPVGGDSSLPEGMEDGEDGLIRYDGGFYLGSDPASPRVGDLRISFEAVSLTEVSLIAQQKGDSFTAYQTKAGGNIELLQVGVHTAEAMIQKAQTDNMIMTWVLRLVGFLLMLFGLNMIFKLFSVLADVLPILGSVVGAGTGIISFLIAAVLSLSTIAVAWIVYRPLLGIILLVAAVGLIAVVMGRIKAGKKNVAAAAAAPPPPPPGV